MVVISSTLPVLPKMSSSSSKLRIMNGSPIEQFTRWTALSKNGPHSSRVSASEGRIDMIPLEVLAVVPLAVHTRRLDVADAVEVDAEAGRSGLKRGARVEQFLSVQHTVRMLPPDERMPLGILMQTQPAHAYCEHAPIVRMKRPWEHATRAKLEMIGAGAHDNRQRGPPVHKGILVDLRIRWRLGVLTAAALIRDAQALREIVKF